MAFISDVVVRDFFRDVHSDTIAEMVTRTAGRFNIGESKALFLLLQYNWNEREMLADNSALVKSAVIFNHSVNVHERAVSEALCPGCNAMRVCHVLDCRHSSCIECLRRHVETQLAANALMLTCPHDTCPYFLNPSTFQQHVTPEQNHGYARILLADYVRRMRDRRIVLVCKFLLACALGVLAFWKAIGRIRSWIRSHPKLINAAYIYFNQVRSGRSPYTLLFWIKLVLKVFFPRRR